MLPNFSPVWLSQGLLVKPHPNMYLGYISGWFMPSVFGF
nr:MAG TPA: hypothetical protein [Caudoviricetes sp.]DAT94299.1 MAG TPA: hypothetical protein [Caudoviricetes sp.]